MLGGTRAHMQTASIVCTMQHLQNNMRAFDQHTHTLAPAPLTWQLLLALGQEGEEPCEVPKVAVGRGLLFHTLRAIRSAAPL